MKVSKCGNEPFKAVDVSVVVLLNRLEEEIRPYGPVDETYILLPTMAAGYRILVKRGTETLSQKSRRLVPIGPPLLPIPEDTQISELTVLRSDAKETTGHERGLGHTANNVQEQAARKHLLQALILPLLVLLVLVPGFLLSVEHIRKETNYNERTNWRDQDSTTVAGNGERLEAFMEVAGKDPLQTAHVAADNPVEVAKCEGWRDWVDYGGGWKGCIP